MIIFDTDLSLGTPKAEIDDGAALIALLQTMGERVAGITTIHGNTNVANVTYNVCRALAYLKRLDVPVGLGADQALIEDKTWFADWQAGYGETEQWDGVNLAKMPAATDLIIKFAYKYPNQLTIIAVGPLTNLALAAQKTPEIVPLMKEVVMMGGFFGGENQAPEFNIRCDPEAAQIALNAGWHVRALGLNITDRIHFSAAEFKRLPDCNPAVSLLKKQAPGWIERVTAQGWGQDSCALHDALAVAAVAEPQLFQWRAASAQVELDGENRGGIKALPATKATPSMQIAVDVDANKCKTWILSALIQRHLTICDE